MKPSITKPLRQEAQKAYDEDLELGKKATIADEGRNSQDRKDLLRDEFNDKKDLINEEYKALKEAERGEDLNNTTERMKQYEAEYLA